MKRCITRPLLRAGWMIGALKCLYASDVHLDATSSATNNQQVIKSAWRDCLTECLLGRDVGVLRVELLALLGGGGLAARDTHRGLLRTLEDSVNAAVDFVLRLSIGRCSDGGPVIVADAGDVDGLVVRVRRAQPHLLRRYGLRACAACGVRDVAVWRAATLVLETAVGWRHGVRRGVCEEVCKRVVVCVGRPGGGDLSYTFYDSPCVVFAESVFPYYLRAAWIVTDVSTTRQLSRGWYVLTALADAITRHVRRLGRLHAFRTVAKFDETSAKTSRYMLLACFYEVGQSGIEYAPSQVGCDAHQFALGARKG